MLFFVFLRGYDREVDIVKRKRLPKVTQTGKDVEKKVWDRNEKWERKKFKEILLAQE